MLLEDYGYRGTFNVCLRNVVHTRLDTRPRMFPSQNVITWDEVRQLQKRGHEIGCHGTRHIDLADAGDEELHMEIVASKKVFQSQGVGVDTYACQFNDYTEKADKISVDYYKTIRGAPGVNTLPFSGRVYHALRGDLALAAAKDEVWVVGIWHDVNSENFLKSVEKIKAAKASVKTVREMT